MKTKAIIFDLYNTLIYTEYKSKPYLDLFKSLELNREELSLWRDKVLTQNYNSFEELKNLIRPESNVYVDKYKYEVEKENENTKVFDDTQFVLEELSKRYELYLISNIATPYKECFYNLGLDRWIKDPVFSCDVGFKKPDSDIYKIVLEKSRMQPSQLLMIGDSPKADFFGPQKLKIPSILKTSSLKLTIKDLI